MPVAARIHPPPDLCAPRGRSRTYSRSTCRLLLWVGTDWHRAWVVVAVLSVGHIALNYMAARILVLKTLNYDRFDTAFDSWCGRKQAEGSSAELLSPKTIAAQESVLPKLRKPWATPEVRATSRRDLSMPTPFKCTLELSSIAVWASDGRLCGVAAASAWPGGWGARQAALGSLERARRPHVRARRGPGAPNALRGAARRSDARRSVSSCDACRVRPPRA